MTRDLTLSSPPAPFTPADYRARMSRVVGDAVEAGLDGMLVMPGPDLARLLREFGHETVDLTVVGSGPNGANPHHETGERVIEPGDAVVLDFGGLLHGYGSDTTRTVSVGEPAGGLRETAMTGDMRVNFGEAEQLEDVVAVIDGGGHRLNETDRALRVVE